MVQGNRFRARGSGFRT